MLHVVVIQDSAQLVLGISTLGKVFSPVRFQSQAVYPGRELSTLTDQWTNQAAKSAPGCVLTAWVYSKPRQVYRLALRMPSAESTRLPKCAGRKSHEVTVVAS